MTDNFELLYEDETEYYYNHKAFFSDDGNKMLLRFLKERDLIVKFTRLFKDVENGIKYRKYLDGRVLVFLHSKKPEKETIDCFCSAYALKDYFLNAFVWEDKEFWCNVHKEWLGYLDKNFKDK